MADEIRRVSRDDEGRFDPAQEDVAATPLEEIRDRELQNIGTKEPIHVASWRAGWDTAVQNIAPSPTAAGLTRALDVLCGIDFTTNPDVIELQVTEAVSALRDQPVPVPPPLQTENEKRAWDAGYEQGRKHGEQRQPNESKAFNDGYERAAAIYKDRRDRAAARLEAMRHRAEKGMPWSEKEVAGVLDVLHGHEDGPDLTAPGLSTAREERDRKAPPNPDLPDYSKPFTARRILHNILGVWSNRSKEYIRGEVQDARDAIDAGRYTDYPEKVEKLATGCGQNNNYDEGYRKGSADGFQMGHHAAQCEDNHRLGRWLRAEDDRRQREIGDRGLKKTPEEDYRLDEKRAALWSLADEADRLKPGEDLPHSPVPSWAVGPPGTAREMLAADHAKRIDDVEGRLEQAESNHRTLRENCKELAQNGVRYEERMDGMNETFGEQADTLREHGRRLAAAADRHDHLSADLVSFRTEARERLDKIERLLRILAPHEERERIRLLELHPENRTEDEKVELNRLNKQVLEGPSGDPDSDRAARIVREAAEAVTSGVITSPEYDRLRQEVADLHEMNRQIREDADNGRKVREALGGCFDQLRKDHDEHVAEYAKHIGPVQTLAQAAMNAAKGASDGVSQVAKRCDTLHTHWENTANKVDSIKADVDRLRTEVGGASGRAETAVAVAREARRIASNPDGDAGAPSFETEWRENIGTEPPRDEIAPDGSQVRPAGSEDVMDMIDAKGREANLPRPDRPLKQTAWDNAENPKQRRGGMATPAPKGAMPAAGARGAADEGGR